MVRLLLILVVGFCVAWAFLSPSCQTSPSLKAGDQATAQLATRVVGDRVAFKLQFVDQDGKTHSSIRLPNGRRPSPPSVTIFNAQNQAIHRFRMRYG